MLASDGRALELLRQEFPELTTLPLPSYNIRYHSPNMVGNMAWQLPNILRAIYLEHRQIQKYILAYGIQGIVSDNRYGCHSSRVPSVFLTHQLFIKIPFRPLEKFVRWVNLRFIRNFDECWMPDVAGEPNLSGELGHSSAGFRSFKNFGSLKYLGALSRMQHFETEKKYDAIAVLSGPEPQRSFLEQETIEQAKKLPHCFLIVQGKTEKQERFSIGKNIEIVSYLTSENLNKAILASGIFIGRSGYSTIMDLAKLGKPALLIPTPGQTEQEYLAGKFFQEGFFNTQKQGEINIGQALDETARFRGLPDDFSDENLLKQAIMGFLSGI